MSAAKHWSEEWDLVVGLEVHAQLMTESKAYSSDANAYGDHPNTNISTLTLGLPGTLPVMNRKSIELAVRMGLACGSRIAPWMHFARKNYFYPDLPKGYQITQDTTPICVGGTIMIPVTSNAGEAVGDRTEKAIRLVRIHLEEDAGKSIHDVDPFNTLVDLNRAGVPLIEIVSEPDIRSSQEAYDYLVEVRRMVRYLDICDGNMEEGSLRCDANISVKRKGTEKLGMRCEVKNLNSFKNVQRAIEHEAQRQSEILAAGGTIEQQTRTFDAAKGTTSALRSKEQAHDYRYFPEPDLQPITVSETARQRIHAAMPPLPRELRAKYVGTLGLSAYDANVLTDDKATALYYEAVIAETGSHKAAANWVTGEVRSWINERGLEMKDFPVKPGKLAGLIALVDGGAISHSGASQKLLPLMIAQPDADASALAKQHDLLQDAGEDVIALAVKDAMTRFPEKVAAYRAGNKGMLGLFMGEVMKASKGKADPRKANDLVKRLLEQDN
ncbi:MAG: Asp-tRNA(Asn)/Glu-tRNA(Gln) amidotransferase subunit GatB [Flavobacteriales bacterium]